MSGTSAVALLLAVTTLLSSGNSNSGFRWGVVTVQGDAFLEQALPLKPLVTTPVGLLKSNDSSAVTVSGRQAITVVYSRPVIALGSDFGKADNFGGKEPFTIKCKNAPVPAGKFRWVTTTIARFDPDVDWPSDLDCTFTFNSKLTAYDGAAVKLTGVSSTRPLRSQRLAMSLQGVSSASADKLTLNQWSATVGMPDDALPEVPPDGVVSLSFSYPVNLDLLRAALQLQPNPTDIKLNITRCVSPVYPYWHGGEVKPAPQSGDDGCVAVSFSKPLKDETKYQLVLPAGSKYSGLTGPTTQPQSVAIAGLRAFRVPIRQDFQKLSSPSDNLWDGVSYRRLKMWLPHGLKYNTDVIALVGQVKLCSVDKPFAANSGCTPVPITSGKLVGLAYVQLQVDGLTPRTKYRVSVAASSSIQDGYGRPLQASQGEFWSTDVNKYFQGPAATPVAVFDKSSLPAKWPYVALGGDSSLNTAQVWSLDVSSEADVSKLVNVVSGSNIRVEDILGTPTDQVGRGSPATATQLELPLDQDKSVHVLAQCCSQIDWPSRRQVSSSVQLVLRSDLSATWVVAAGQQVMVWVTSADATKPGPVAGATAYLYYQSWEGNSTLLGTCVTANDGSCSVPLAAPSSMDSKSLLGVVRGPGKDLVYTPSVGFWSQNDPVQYTGTLVLDRALVRPGDALHVAGYVAQKSNSKAADAPSVTAPSSTIQGVLVVTPSWTDPSGYTNVSVEVDAVYGSLHATLPVPAGANMGSFQVTLYIPAASPGSTSMPPVMSRGIATTTMPGPGGKRRSLAQAMMGKPVMPPNGGGNAGGGFDSSGLIVLATQAITVSDPRPPTADLILKAPAWVKPQGKIEVSLQAISYLGSQVSAASIDVKWQTPKAQGLLTVTTDATGAAKATIDLDQLPAANKSDSGDTASLEAVWVGPTRERIVRTATVKLQNTARRVEFSRTLDTNVPGVPFGIDAHVFSNENDQEIKGVPLEVSLLPFETTSGTCGDTSSCKYNSGDSAAQDACQLSLPCIGHYALLVCTDGSSDRACANTTFGLNSTEWQSQPLSQHAYPSLSPSAEQFKLGDTAGLKFQNAWAKATALVVWGNTEQALRTKLFLGLKPGPATLNIELGSECKGGCSAMAIISVPRQAATAIPTGVVVSKLFDYAGAHTVILTTTLTVIEPRELEVTVAVSSSETTAVNGQNVSVVAPGGSASVSVTVGKDGKPAGNAEVTLLAVDKAVLDLLPYPLRDLVPELSLNLAASLSGTDADSARVKPGVVDLVFSTLARRLKLDPWLPVDTTIFPYRNWGWGSSLAAVDQTDTQYLDLFTSLITYAPSSGSYWGCQYGVNCYAADLETGAGPLTGAQPMPAPGRGPPPSPVFSKAGGSNSSGSRTSARLTSKFLATPLFTTIKTQADGRGQATFKAPANLGTFIVRAYAVQPQLAGLGRAETQLVVRRKLSLTASTPRIVRTGDDFLAGVLVTAPGLPSDAAEFTVTITLKLNAAPGSSVKPLKLVSKAASATIKLSGAKNQAEVRFHFQAFRIGSASLTFTATDASGASDALVTTLPVLPPQSPVFVATSFALKPSTRQGVTWQEGLQLPAAVTGSGSIDLTAGVGNLPAILAALGTVAQQRKASRSDVPLDATTSLALASAAPLLGSYSQQLSSAQQQDATEALAALVSLTDSRLGLLPYKPGTWGYYPNRADIVLNAQAVWLVTHLPSYTKGSLAAQWASLLKQQVPVWKDAAVRQLLADATESRNPSYPGVKPAPYTDYYTLAWVRLALGGEWEVQMCGMGASTLCTPDNNVKSDLSLSTLLAAAPQAGLDVQVLLANALQGTSSRGKYSTFITTTTNALVSSLRVTGRTAYVAAYPGARSAAPLDLQAFALNLLRSLSRPDLPALVQKLDAYLAAAGAPTAGGHPSFAGILPPMTPSPWVVAVVCSSLAAYDKAQGSTQPDLTLTARVNSLTLLKASFNKQTVGKPPVSSTTPWSKLGRSPGPLQFNVQGTGEASVSAGLTFVPAKPITFPTYRGVWVTSVIQATDPLTGEAVGPALVQAPLGSLLTITVQVVSPDDLGATTVEALVAGGLEPLDPALTSSADLPATPVCPLIQWLGNDAWRGVFWGWWWPLCPAQEIRPSVVTWKWQRLPAGTHTLVYRAVAATQGTFQLPPIKVYADDQPEVMGMTPSALFKVCAGSKCKAQAAPPTAALPKDCPQDCNGNGACNTSTGTCVCSPGWVGTDCSVQQ